MHPSNLVVAESLEYLVAEALGGLSNGAWVKARETIDTTSGSDLATWSPCSDSGAEAENAPRIEDGDETEECQGKEDGPDANVVLVQERTFLTFVQAPRAPGSVVQSTTDTDIYKGMNPRRQAPGGIGTA